MNAARELQTISKEDVGVIAFAPITGANATITNAHAFSFIGPTKTLGHIELDGTIVIEMTDAELQEVADSDFDLRPYALLMLEISRLRKQIQ